MLFVKERLSKWIEAAIILVVGILCIVAGAAIGGKDGESARAALDGISQVLGIVLIVMGSLSVVLGVVVAILVKKGFAAVALPGAILLAVGISLLVAKYGADLIFIILTVIPYLLLCIGGVLLIEAIFNLVFAILSKKAKDALVGVIFMSVLAVAMIVIGALCVGSKPVIDQYVQLIVFGIIVCLVACLMVVLTFVKLPTLVVISKSEEKKAE